MIHLVLFVLAVLVMLYLVHELWFWLLYGICKPFADREERRYLAREAKRHADLCAAHERDYQEYMRAEDERARLKRVLARIALECFPDAGGKVR
jgi:hypothetical protein